MAHSAGNIKAYELWNEPGYDDKGTCTTAVYTTLLNETRPNIRATGNDPNAMVIAFAGCPNLTSGYVNMAGGAGQRHRGADGRGQRAHLRPDHAAREELSHWRRGPPRGHDRRRLPHHHADLGHRTRNPCRWRRL